MNDDEKLRYTIARSEIHELVARFSDAAVRNDPEAFGALWTEDGVWELGQSYPNKSEGVPAIVSFYKAQWKRWAWFVELTHSGVVEFESENTAQCRWIMREMAGTADGKSSHDTLVMYDDRVVRGSDGTWRFSKRTYNVIWRSDSPLVGRPFSFPEFRKPT